jgi:hypothetical protein
MAWIADLLTPLHRIAWMWRQDWHNDNNESTTTGF